MQNNQVQWWQPTLFAAMAGGMAWGIRGQYGHETGAMIAGLLVSLTLVYLLAPTFPFQKAIRAIAWGTIAMGFGGSMTYGLTVGLTHNPDMVGQWEPLLWGLTGLGIKGGLWIGFCAVFLGMGLSGVKYRTHHIAILMFAIVGTFFIGGYLLNSPFDPENKRLPMIYFSDPWSFGSTREYKPRPECWGGELLGFLTLVGTVGLIYRDKLASRMAVFGFLGGMFGFPIGQCIQAFHAWNPEFFQGGVVGEYAPFINWWNMMETTFGAIMGSFIGFGLWCSRHLISVGEMEEQSSLPFGLEWILLLVHLVMLVCVEFLAIRWVDMFYDHGVILGMIPIICVAASRWWALLMIFPVTLLPIAGKTVRQLVYNESSPNPEMGWVIYLVIPLLISSLVMLWMSRKQVMESLCHKWVGYALLFNAWLYFLINYAFFHFPYPWAEWTGRTPNGIIFAVCVIGLTVCFLINKRKVSL